MKRTSYIIILLLLTLSSCRIPLNDEIRTKYRIEIETQYKERHNIPQDNKKPNQYRVNFYNPSTGRLEVSNTINGDSGYLYGLSAGVYNVIIYDRSFNKTKIAYEDNFNTVIANTAIASYGSLPSVESPDHLYVKVLRDVKIPYLTDNDPLWTFHVEPETIMEDWLLIVDGIKGLENATNVNCYITGQSGGKVIWNGALLDKDVTIFFPIVPNLSKGIIETPFNTFGRQPGKQVDLILNLIVTGSGGESYICRENITDQFDKEVNIDRIIRTHFDIVIRERQDGGFAPVADPWDSEYEDININ